MRVSENLCGRIPESLYAQLAGETMPSFDEQLKERLAEEEMCRMVAELVKEEPPAKRHRRQKVVGSDALANLPSAAEVGARRSTCGMEGKTDWMDGYSCNPDINNQYQYQNQYQGYGEPSHDSLPDTYAAQSAEMTSGQYQGYDETSPRGASLPIGSVPSELVSLPTKGLVNAPLGTDVGGTSAIALPGPTKRGSSDECLGEDETATPRKPPAYRVDPWGPLTPNSMALPFEVEDVCIQVFARPKGEKEPPEWQMRVEINHPNGQQDKWEQVFSSSLVPMERFPDRIVEVVKSGYDMSDAQQGDYARECWDAMEPYLQNVGKWRMGALLISNNAGGKPPNHRPLHVVGFVNFGNVHLGDWRVAKDKVWRGKAMVLLSGAPYHVDLEWKKGAGSALLIGSRKIWHGQWHANQYGMAINTGDADGLSKDDWR